MSDDLDALLGALHQDSFVLVGAAHGGFGAVDYPWDFRTACALSCCLRARVA